jgi:hypothetical protein
LELEGYYEGRLREKLKSHNKREFSSCGRHYFLIYIRAIILNNSMTNRITGWSAIILNSVFASVWSFWGIIENFHEGWYYDSLIGNIELMLVQYLSFALIYISVGFISIQWNKIGGVLFISFAALIPLKFNTSAALFIFSLPMGVNGVLYFFSTIKKGQVAYLLIVGLPISIMLLLSIEPLYRISNRSLSYSPTAATVKGNGIELIWAPQGPGWPASTKDLTYKSWNDVVSICAHLSEDGKTISDSSLNVWRLPSVEEVTRSLTRNGRNAGGMWLEGANKGIYKVKPDKEPPLWKVHSPIIYWWTCTEVNDTTVYRIVYNGTAQKIHKDLKMGSLGFRAVRNPKKDTSIKDEKINMIMIKF